MRQARARRTRVGIFMPKAPSSASALTYLVGDLRLALDPRAVDRRSQHLAQPGEERLAARPRRPASGRGCGWTRSRSKPAEEQLLGEARLAPPALARLLGDLAGLPLGDPRRAPRPRRRSVSSVCVVPVLALIVAPSPSVLPQSHLHP